MKKLELESSWLWSLVKLKVSSFLDQWLNFTFKLHWKLQIRLSIFANFRMLPAFWVVVDKMTVRSFGEGEKMLEVLPVSVCN